MAEKAAFIYWNFKDKAYFRELESSFAKSGFHLRDPEISSVNIWGLDPSDSDAEESGGNGGHSSFASLYGPMEENIVYTWKAKLHISYSWWAITESGMDVELSSGLWPISDTLIGEAYWIHGLRRPYLQQVVRSVEERFFFLADHGLAELFVVDLGGGTREYDWAALALGTKTQYEDIADYINYPNVIGVRGDKAANLIEYFSEVPGWSSEKRGDYVILKGANVDQHPDPIDLREYLEQRRRRFWE